MPKKKDEYNPDDPDTWSDAQFDKYIIDQVMGIAKNLPYDKIVLSVIFTYAWWKSYGAGKLPTKGDVALGIVYALTIPEALKGGTVANTYAVTTLSTLGLGLLPPGAIEEVKKSVALGPYGYPVNEIAMRLGKWIAEQVP